MEKSGSIASYILTGFISFCLLGGLAAGMFYLGRVYTLRETEKVNSESNQENVQDTKVPTNNTETPTITYKSTTFKITDTPNGQGTIELQASIPTDATINENINDASATIIYKNASLKFYIIHMGFPKTVRKYEIIPNSNMTTKLYRVTFKDGKISYVTDYEEKDITKCSNPDITPTLPCGLLLHISDKSFITEFTGKEDDLEVFDKIMSSLNLVK